MPGDSTELREQAPAPPNLQIIDGNDLMGATDLDALEADSSILLAGCSRARSCVKPRAREPRWQSGTSLFWGDRLALLTSLHHEIQGAKDDDHNSNYCYPV